MKSIDRQIQSLEDAKIPHSQWRRRLARAETLRRLRARKKFKPLDTRELPF